MTSNEDRLTSTLTDISLIYADYKQNNSPAKKIDSYNKCNLLIQESKRLIEELKIEIINMDKNSNKATREQLNQAKLYIELAQLPGLHFDQLKQIIVSLREMHNAIPTEPNVVDDIENEIFCDVDDLNLS